MITSEFRAKKYVFQALEIGYGDFSKMSPMIVADHSKSDLLSSLGILWDA